jgi:hypothetical protein
MEDMYITESSAEKKFVVENDHKLFDDVPEPDHAQVAEEFDDSKPSNSSAVQPGTKDRDEFRFLK